MGSTKIQSFIFHSLFTVTLFAYNLALQKPESISDHMYCLGCEVTVKELDFILSRKPTRGMGETVTRALARVCDINNFNKYDVDSKKVLEVCKHIKDDEGMEALLITEYGRKHAQGKKTTYLDMTQLICGTVIEACKNTDTMDTIGDDGGISYNPDTEAFIIKHGKKVRIPNPVANGVEIDPIPEPKDVLKKIPKQDIPKPDVNKPIELATEAEEPTKPVPVHIHEHQEL